MFHSSIFELEALEEFSHIRLSDYHYDLPEDRIAIRPLSQRDQSKLLVYQQGEIQHHGFSAIPALLPTDALLVFNDTRVIQARLYFRRMTGALIEVLLLHPDSPSEVAQAMIATPSCRWACVIGRKKRWKPGEILKADLGNGLSLHAELIDREQNIVQFSWDDVSCVWGDILQKMGELPLPPYLNRKATEEDLEQYQTVYAKEKGAVAAPTAGLHFTDQLLQQLPERGIKTAYVTLHVSAGTFLPVKHDRVIDHPMHAEQIIIRPEQVRLLIQHLGNIIPVGTTSLRLLESLYWIGVWIDRQQMLPSLEKVIHLEQFYPYQVPTSELPAPVQALEAILHLIDHHQIPYLIAETHLFILPGYQFQLCQGLITNYHMPETTLLLLVAALVGEDWRNIYESAMDNGYRFLSYGDSSLLLP
ncbi:MAG: S-adenosylmethionine:tRNA ribosyltransferase-isomerase [Bacteroidota bacterium]